VSLRPRGHATSVLLLAAGLAGALGGGWLIARWAFGLVLIAESGGVCWLALARDDGAVPRVLPRPGDRTVGDVLEHVRRLP
jgi:hypothetical protein